MTFKRAETRGHADRDRDCALRFVLAHALVLRKFRPQLGCDRLKFFGSGSAALHIDIAFTFAAADIVILRRLRPHRMFARRHRATTGRDARIGTVGRPIPTSK